MQPDPRSPAPSDAPADGAPAGLRSTPPDASRRRLLKAGAPVVLTIASAPVTATTCVTASASTSMAASRNARHTNYLCTGKSASWWRDASSSSWPVDKSAAKFADFFTPVVTIGTNTNPTLHQVLQASASTDMIALARAVVAALLNAKSLPPRVPSSVYTAASLRALWSDSQDNSYQVTQGIGWNRTQTRTWLETTFLG
jgi:hypothetical protein